MKITATRSNQTEVEFPNGYTVLFSYSTPVIAHKDGERPKVTSQRYSSTTSRHVNQWLTRNDFDRSRCETVSPEELKEVAG